jgi:hypothetical protein
LYIPEDGIFPIINAAAFAMCAERFQSKASDGCIDGGRAFAFDPLQRFLPSQLFALVLRQAFSSLKGALQPNIC